MTAFEKWRGKRPTGGYGYDRMKWDYETRDMKKAWNAALRWERSKRCVWTRTERGWKAQCANVQSLFPPRFCLNCGRKVEVKK